MLDYQTAIDLFKEIEESVTVNNEESLVEDLIIQSTDYVKFLTSENIKGMFHDELDDFQRSITEDSKRDIEKNLITTINAIGVALKVSTITRVLSDDADKLKFARYVVLYELAELQRTLAAD